MPQNTPRADQEGSNSWPDLKRLFIPIKQHIISIHTRSVLGVDQAIIQFKNGYGVIIFRDQESDNALFEMTVVKFHGKDVNDYEFIHSSISLPDLNFGYAKENILELCERVSLL